MEMSSLVHSEILLFLHEFRQAYYNCIYSPEINFCVKVVLQLKKYNMSQASFIQYVHKLFRKAIISYLLIRMRTCAYQEVTPDTHTYACVSGGKKCQFFGKFCVRTKGTIPLDKLREELVQIMLIEVSFGLFRKVPPFRIVRKF